MTAVIQHIPTQDAASAEQADMQHVAVARIRRNPTVDPRKGRNTALYSQIKESIRQHGVQQPIIIRPVDEPEFDYEVVAGNTRWQASVDLELLTIPAIIRDLTEAQARIIAAIENMQRADLTPIEEAQHAVVVLADCGNDHAEVMKLLGWSRTRLDSRIMLSRACPEVRDALLQGQIKIGHAELLCRLVESEQAPILAKIIDQNLTVKDTQDRLFTIARDISSARFDTKDCASCRHNSAAYVDLFDTSVAGAKCQNATCWNQKTSQLIEVKLIEARDEFGVVHTDLTLPKDGYVQLEAKGPNGVGDSQITACLSCSNYGAVVSTTAGHEGTVAGGYCFDRNCNKDMREAYKAALAEAAGQQNTHEPANNRSTEPLSKTASATTPASKQAAGKSKDKPAQPQALKKSIRREAFNLYGQMGSKAVQGNRRLALAIAVVSMYLAMRSSLPHELANRIKKKLGMPEAMLDSSRCNVEVELAKLEESELLELLTNLASCTTFRNDSADSFEKSLPGSQSIAYIKHEGMQPVEHFQMSENYLKSLVKAGIIADCKRSGFEAKYNEVHGDKAFVKLSTEKTDTLIKAVLEFKEFSWAGYLPEAFEISVQAGSGTRRSA
ncbi:PRTRC system ParB family protein (plasmid) [Pseudomonas aeruginosa]|uniref:PRTRC system ParB family protein n=1 Tax=Pseudomonas aeruginosa TaxID=287 RepID=UPI00399CCF2C